ncbi:hypothetical protein [Shinella sp. BYT-45]|uniref:hypothetical protein n=1 Tax=Shinella sp. BYT-45 TaxID=3377377 RepID=UPI0039807BD1
MTVELFVRPDASDLVAAIETARSLLDAGATEAALKVSSVAYDQAKAAGDSAERVKASRDLVDRSRRMQAEALKIESLCYVAMADAVDEAQAKGEIARRGRPKNVSDRNIFTLDEIGLDRGKLHEVRKLRDRVRQEPDFIERVVETRLAEGLEPSRAALKRAAGHAIGTRAASQEEQGDKLYETAAEATRSLLALESFSAVVKEPFVGKGAILRVMEAAGYDMVISDLRDRGVATRHGELQQVGNFLHSEPGETLGMDIVSNPPYGRDANACLAHALRVHRPRKMAVLLNLNFMCGFDDPDRVFVMDENPPSRVYVFTRRLEMMHRDGWAGPEASSQMNTAWFVWERNADGTYGLGRGRWETIRIDWKVYEAAPPLAPGEGGHRAALLFGPVGEDFTRTTPRLTLDERVDGEIERAVLWLKEMRPFDAVILRRAIGVRPSVAEALILAMAENDLIEKDAEGLWRPTAQGLHVTAAANAADAVRAWRAERTAAA